MDGSLLSRYTAARQSVSVQKGGKGKIFIIVGVLLIVSVLISVFSGMFNFRKEEEKEEEEEEEDTETGPSCQLDKKIRSGNLGACDSVSDIDPVGVTFTGAYFKPKAPTKDNSWIHELSSTGDTKEYIAAHQASDNFCKMVRFQIKKSGDVCRYQTLDAGYVSSPNVQGASLCMNKTNVLDNWSKKTVQKLASRDTDVGYGIQELKYNKFCD